MKLSKPTTRRDFVHALSLLPFASALAATAQTPMQTPAAKTCEEPTLTHCQAFPFETLPLRYSDAGAPTRQILEGRVPTGEVIELHETTLGPGKIPHPPHRHPHAELLLVRSGTIEFITDAGKTNVTAGGAAYCAPNEFHGFHNVGQIDAVYFVVKVGAQPVCQK